MTTQERIDRLEKAMSRVVLLALSFDESKREEALEDLLDLGFIELELVPDDDADARTNPAKEPDPGAAADRQ